MGYLERTKKILVWISIERLGRFRLVQYHEKLTILGKAPVSLRPKNSVDWSGGSNAFDKKGEMRTRSVCWLGRCQGGLVHFVYLRRHGCQKVPIGESFRLVIGWMDGCAADG